MTIKKQIGFTLIELIFVIIIMSIISVVVGRILFQSYQLLDRGLNISEMSWQGFIAVERVINDIHTIRSPSDISTAGAQQLVFTDVNGSSVQYQLSGATLLRNGIVLASNIQSLSFSYRNSSGATTSTPSAMRYIIFSVTTTSGGITNTFTSMGAVR